MGVSAAWMQLKGSGGASPQPSSTTTPTTFPFASRGCAARSHGFPSAGGLVAMRCDRTGTSLPEATTKRVVVTRMGWVRENERDFVCVLASAPCPRVGFWWWPSAERRGRTGGPACFALEGSRREPKWQFGRCTGVKPAVIFS